MSQLNHKGPKNKGAKTGRKLGLCKKSEEEEKSKGKLGEGLGKRLHSTKTGVGKAKRKQYNIKKEKS